MPPDPPLRDDEFADWLHFVSDPVAEMPEDEVVAAFERALIELKALRLVADAAERAVKDAPNLFYLADTLRIAGRLKEKE